MRLRRWLAILSVCILLTGLFSQTALAATAVQGNVTVDQAVSTLRKFGIVVGDPDGNMRLGDPITRAELVKILIAAMGQEEQARALQGAGAFPDTRNHWASGYIAVAKSMNLATGYPDGTFQPQNNVTNAEVLAFLVRAVGVGIDQALTWPDNVINPAVQAGIVPPDLDIRWAANLPATRGVVFLMAHRAFLLVKGSDGKNLYQRYWDQEAPALTLNEVPSVTTEAKVTVSGKATGAVQVLVNGEAMPLNADGSFSAVVDLEIGDNEITVAAVDEVGNTTTRILTVGRSAGEPADIEAPSTVTLKAGESRVLDIVVKDANGLAIPYPDITAEVSDDIGTFDPQTMTFTAGEKTGVGTLTLKAGNATARVTITVIAGDVAKVVVTADKESVAVGEQLKVTAKAYDAAGNEITGLPVLYSVVGAGALIDAQTGVFVSYREGIYTIRATVGSVTGEVKVGVYGDPVDLEIEGPSEIVGNGKGTVPFRVKVVDRNGTLVAADEPRTVELESDTWELVFLDENGNPLVNNRLTLKNGVATFYVQAGAELWGLIAEITATDVEDDDFRDSISVEIVEQEPAAVAVVRQDQYLAANSSSTASVYLAVVDEAGVEMLDGAWDIEWSIRGPALEDETEEQSGVLTYYGGEGPARLILRSLTGELGEVTVTARADGLKSATAKLTATVVGNPSRIQLTVNRDGQPVGEDFDDSKGVEVTVTITDSKGVPVPYSGNVVINFSGDLEAYEATDDGEEPSGEDTNDDPNRLDDQLTLEFNRESSRTFRFVSTKAGKYTMTAKASGLESATATATLKPGPAEKAGFTTKATLVSFRNPDSKATVQLMDAFGNPVAQAGVSITVRASSEVLIQGKRSSATVRTDGNGQATFTFSVRPKPLETYTIEVEDVEGLEADPETGTLHISVLPAVPKQVSVSFEVDRDDGKGFRSSGSAAAGNLVRIRASVKDEYGFSVEGLEDYLDLVVPDGAFDVTGDPPGDSLEVIREYLTSGDLQWVWEDGDPDDDTDGYYYLEVTAAKAGTHPVSVRLNVSGETVSGTRSINITAGPADHVIVREAQKITKDGGEITLVRGKLQQVTLEVVDAWNNPVRSGTYDIEFYSPGILIRETPTAVDIDSLRMGTRKTIYLVAPTVDDGGPLTISLDDGDSWVLHVTVNPR